MSLVCGAAPIEVMIMCVPHVQPWAPEIDDLPSLLCAASPWELDALPDVGAGSWGVW